MSAVELAVGYISLVPSAKNITAGLMAELGAPVEAVAKQSAEKASGQFSSAFSNAGKVVAAGLAIGLTAAVAVGGALFKIGSEFDEASDKIRVGTGATGEALAGLNKDFKTVFASIPTSMGSASTAISELNQKLGLSGAPLQAVSKQVLELSRVTNTDLKGNIDATAGVLNNWGVATKDQGRRLDELFRASQATGVSVADLSGTMAKSGSTLRQVGLSFEDSAAVLGLLNKAGVDAGAVMPALSRSIAKAAKDGKSATDVFRDTFNAISKAPSDTAAAAAAIDVFGAKAGPNLAGLIRQGKLSYEELAKSIADGKDTIVGAAADTNDMGEKWTIFKNKAEVAIAPVATAVFNLGGILADKLIPAMNGAGEVVDFVKRHLDVIGPVLAGLAIGVGAVLVPTLIAWAAAATAAAIATIAAAAPIIALVIGIAALAAGLIYAYTHFSVFRDIVNDAARVVRDVFATAVDYVKLVIGVAIDYVQLIARVIGDVVKIIVAIFHGDWRGAWDAFKDIPKAAVDFIGSTLDRIIGFVSGLGKRISGVTAGMWDGIKDAFRATINWILRGWNGLQFTIPGIDTHIPGVGKIGGFTLGVPNIPLLASGGTAVGAGLAIVGEHGPELAYMNRGATIAPLSPASAPAGSTFTINVTAGMGADPRAIGSEVVRAIQVYERDNGAGWRSGVRPGFAG